MIAVDFLCPLNFSATVDKYVQRFAVGDTVHVRFRMDSTNEIIVELVDIDESKVVERLLAVEVANGIYDALVQPLAGYYKLRAICGDLELHSGVFQVVENTDELNRYVVLDYNNGGDERFRFRVEGGFIADSDTNGIDNEFLRNERAELKQLYQFPYIKSRLTVGSATGVPGWVGTLLNTILCLYSIGATPQYF